MQVAITGASGFVGQNLSSYLENRKYKVQKLSLRSENWKEKMNHTSNVIIHLAGKAHDTSNTSDEEEYFKVNRDLTIEVFKKFLQSSARDFFYFSSVKAVADTVGGILDEEAVANPLTPYGKSKYEAEQYLLKQVLPEGKRLFIIRPSMIHGPGNKGNLNLLYNAVKKGIPWPLASYHNQRSFLGIDNLCYLIEQMLIDESISSGVYNFTDDATISTNELVSIISTTLGKKPKLWKIPSGLINNLVKLGDVLPLPLNSERLKKLTESYVVSNTKVKMALGVERLPFTAEEGLRKTIESFE